MFRKSIVCCYLYPITQYGYPPPAENTFKYLEEMKALGFQSMELEGIRQDHLTSMYDLRFSIKERMDALNLTVPYYCTVLPWLSSADKEERNASLKLFEKGCETARVLGAQGVLDNGPLPPYRFPENIPLVRHFDEAVLRQAVFPAGLNWSGYWTDLVGTYRTVCDIAADFGLSYHVHPCLGVLASTTDGFLYFHDAVGRDNLRFNFDTANQFFLKDNLALSLRRLAGHVDYIHLSDNGGERVEHLGMGDGVINWDTIIETLRLIGFEGEIGLDIGGGESHVKDLDDAYVQAAQWLESHWQNEK